MLPASSSYTEDDSSSYASWPLDQSQFMYPQYTCPSSISTYLDNDHGIDMKHFAEYQLSQPEILGSDVYASWNIPQDTTGYFYNCRQSDQNSSFLKQTDGYSLGSDPAIYISDYPANVYDFDYSLESSADIPLQFRQISQSQLPMYGATYSDLYSHNPGQWELEESIQYTAMPGLISSANSVASLSPLSEGPSPQNSSLASIPYFEDDNTEPLQGLGLYDCPDLAMDEAQSSFGHPDSRRASLGKGLKLEESFQFNEDCLEDDDEEDDEWI